MLLISNTLLNSFYGHYFHPHGLITTCLVELGDKIVIIEVEVMDGPIYCNILLGHGWVHVITIFIYLVSSLKEKCYKWLVRFLHSLSKFPHPLESSLQWGCTKCSSRYSIGIFKDASLIVNFTFPMPIPIVKDKSMHTIISSIYFILYVN